MSAPIRAHDWAIQRLPEFSMGLLDEQDAEEMESHVADCDSCQEAAATMRERVLADFGHLPSSLLTAWATRSGQLEGLQRELTRRHLSSCDSCRQLLMDFGHEPVLPRIEALEANDRVMALLPPAESQREHARPPVPIQSHSRWRDLFRGGFVGAGLAAAAAALVFAINPFSRGTGGDTPAPSPIPSVQAPAWGISLAPGAVTQELVARGGGGEVRSVEPGLVDSVMVLRPDQRTLRIGLPQRPDVPAGTAVEVALLTEQGTIIDRFPTEYGALLRGDRGLTLVSSTPLEPGRFLVRLSWLAADGSRRAADYPLELSR